jgi:hypothetical protein
MSNIENELKIKENKFEVGQIEVDFAEIVEEAVVLKTIYSNLIVTEKDIDQAKKDRAKLNNLVKRISDWRIARKKVWMSPFETLEAEVTRVSKIIGEGIDNLDRQLKDYEATRVLTRREAIFARYNTLNIENKVPFERILDNKWLNASTTDKQWQTQLDDIAKKTHEAWNTIEHMGSKLYPEVLVQTLFKEVAQTNYSKTLDINMAMQAGTKAVDETLAIRDMFEAQKAVEEAIDESIKAPQQDVEIIQPTQKRGRYGIYFEDYDEFEKAVETLKMKNIKFFVE